MVYLHINITQSISIVFIIYWVPWNFYMVDIQSIMVNSKLLFTQIIMIIYYKLDIFVIEVYKYIYICM